MYDRFKKSTSKNNSYTLKKYNEEQFKKTFYRYKVDFVFSVKQYYHHMPIESEITKLNLFMQPILSPMGNIWYNKVHKVSRETVGKRLKNMLMLVGLPGDCFSNRSGRCTRAGRMAAKGVLDEIEMMITGHYTEGGYACCDYT